MKNGSTKIGKYAFSGCSNATTIKFGTGSNDKSTVSEIATLAFNSCSSMADVYFYETIDKWLNIAFESTSSAPFYGVASGTTDHKFYLNSLVKILIRLAPYTFAVYLIHDNPYIRTLLWNKLIDPAIYWQTPTWCLLAIAVPIVILLACCLIDYVRARIFSLIGVDKLVAFIKKYNYTVE